MEMNVRDDAGMVEIYLSNTEKNDPKLCAGLQDVYDRYRKKKYLVAVFESGEKDLYRTTLDLLVFNKKRMPQTGCAAYAGRGNAVSRKNCGTVQRKTNRERVL